MGLEFKAQDSNNNGYPLQVYGNVGQYGKSAYGSTVAGSVEKNTGQIQFTYDFDNLPAVFTSETGLFPSIPANAYITGASIKIISTLTGGTDFKIGLSETDGSVVDSDGIMNSSTLSTGHFIGNGADIGTATVTAVQLTVAAGASGIRTGGVMEVTVNYAI
jgi:hypothetical protein